MEGISRNHGKDNIHISCLDIRDQLESVEIMGQHDTFARQNRVYELHDMRNEDGADRLF